MRYGVFLSYSHADEAHARWLLQKLEGYRVPKRLVAALVVLCSPAAARSRWVNAEV